MLQVSQYLTSIVIKSLGTGTKIDMKIKRLNTEDTTVNLHNYSHLIFSKHAQIYVGEKGASSTNGAEKTETRLLSLTLY
jgi:hypothetical protein